MRKSFFVIIAALLVAVAGAAAALYIFTRPVVLRVAVAPGGEDFQLLSAAAHVFSRQHEGLRLHLVPSTEAAEAAALDSGAADLAVLRADDGLTPSAQAVAILHRNVALLVAPGGSKLRKVADLRSRRVGLVTESGGAERAGRLLERILAQSDVAMKTIALTRLTVGDVKAALAENRIDALFILAPPQGALAHEAVAAVAALSARPLVFIPISEAKAIAKQAPALEPVDIVHGAFGGDPPRPAEDVAGLGVSVLLAARNTLSDDLAGDVTRLLFTNRAAIAAVAPLANAMEAPSTDKSAAIPVHRGAADYLDGNEHSFFDRYSDFFYLGAMLVSLMGSGAAALASRFNVSTHHHVEQLAERLLEILQAARAAETLAELDELEREVDNLLAAALSDRRLRSVEAPGLSVVSLALDQARRAIRERRRFLGKETRIVSLPVQRAPGG